MKKLFVSMVLGLMILVGCNSFASAEDVYVGTYGYKEVYINNERVKGKPDSFACQVALIDHYTGESTRVTYAYYRKNKKVMWAERGFPYTEINPNGYRLQWAIYEAGLGYLQ